MVLDVSAPTGLLRYVRRTLFERERCGGLEGGRDSVKWAMLRHIAAAGPGRRRRDREIFERSDLPKISLSGRRETHAFYRASNLQM